MIAAQHRDDLGHYCPQLVRFARSRLLDPAQAEDAVQETLLAAIESIDSFSGGSSLITWLTGILKHKIVDCVRRNARDRWYEIDNDGTPLPTDGFGPFRIADGPRSSTGWGEPEEALMRRRLAEAVEKCVRKLPRRTAETFVLRDVAGLSTAETCRVLSVSETNCSVMLHRARARIRASLDPVWIAR